MNPNVPTDIEGIETKRLTGKKVITAVCQQKAGTMKLLNARGTMNEAILKAKREKKRACRHGRNRSISN